VLGTVSGSDRRSRRRSPVLALASILERDPALTQRVPREGPKNGEPTTAKGGEAVQDTVNDTAVVFLGDSLIRVFFIREEKDYFRRSISPQTPSFP
jgi:hypothetical protein